MASSKIVTNKEEAHAFLYEYLERYAAKLENGSVRSLKIVLEGRAERRKSDENDRRTTRSRLKYQYNSRGCGELKNRVLDEVKDNSGRRVNTDNRRR